MLKELRNALKLTDAQRDTLQRRLGEAYQKACDAFTPYEEAVCSSDKGWRLFPESVLDIETLELSGMRIQDVLHGRCSLAAMLDNNPIELVEKFEQEAADYIAGLATVPLPECP
jgi:hypothetical protein